MDLSTSLDVLMFAGVIAVLLAGFPVAFSLAGTALAFALLGLALGAIDFRVLSALPSRIFGVMTNEVLVAVPLFIFMGVMLERSKVAEELLDSMARMFGSLRGGLGISVSVVGALLAASTGIVGATVVTMGLLSLPIMLRRGYDPRLACGSICAAGTLGQIIPPSIVLVLLGDVLSGAHTDAQRALGNFAPDPVTVGDLFAGALLPGLLLVGLYILYQAIIAWLRPESSPAVPPAELAAGRGQFLTLLGRALLPPVLLIIGVLGSILAGVATPTEAASVGAVGALLLAGLRIDAGRGTPVYVAFGSLVGMLVLARLFDLRIAREAVGIADRAATALALLLCLGLAWGVLHSVVLLVRARVMQQVIRSTVRINAMVFVILVGAAVFSLVFRGFGGDETVHRALTSLPGGPFGAMVVVMAVMFLLGFIIDFIEIIFIVVPIVSPALLLMGLDPIWLGVMMAVNLQTSFLTPPFGFALFYLRGVAPPEVRTADIYRGIVPFVAMQLVALAILAAVPALATWLPRAMFE